MGKAHKMLLLQMMHVTLRIVACGQFQSKGRALLISRSIPRHWHKHKVSSSRKSLEHACLGFPVTLPTFCVVVRGHKYFRPKKYNFPIFACHAKFIRYVASTVMPDTNHQTFRLNAILLRGVDDDLDRFKSFRVVRWSSKYTQVRFRIAILQQHVRHSSKYRTRLHTASISPGNFRHPSYCIDSPDLALSGLEILSPFPQTGCKILHPECPGHNGSTVPAPGPHYRFAIFLRLRT